LSQELYEIIVVDNNSGDETVEIVNEVAKRGATSIEYILETRQGLSYARNTGVGHAKGEIVAFLDDDAEADRHWLSSLLEVYESLPDAWAAGGPVRPIWDARRPEWLDESMLRGLSIVEWGDEARPLAWPERIIGTNCSFRKAAFSEVGQFKTGLGRRGKLLLGSEDTEIQERIHASEKFVFYTPLAIVYHHVPPERVTKKYFYRRGYGHGMTRAIILADQGSPRELAKQMLESFWTELSLIRLLRNYHSFRGDPGSLFKVWQGFIHHCGFVLQAAKLLLTGKAFHSRGSQE
jgi:glycosyltransferase involved in cell wall biosynthesis